MNNIEIVTKYLRKVGGLESDIKSLTTEIEALENMSTEEREQCSYGFEGMITFVSVDVSYNEALRLFKQMKERKELEYKQCNEKLSEFVKWIKESK